MVFKLTRLPAEPGESLFFAYHPKKAHLVVGPATAIGERERFHEVFKELLRERYGLKPEDADLLYENPEIQRIVHTNAVSGVVRGKSVIFTTRNLTGENLHAAILALHFHKVVTPEHRVGVAARFVKDEFLRQARVARLRTLGRVSDLYTDPNDCLVRLAQNRIQPIQPGVEPRKEEVQEMLEIAAFTPPQERRSIRRQKA